MARKYIMLYYDFTETANEMKDADLANLVRAMLHYGRGEDPAPFLSSEVTQVLFNGSFRGQIDRNNEFDDKRSQRMSQYNKDHARPSLANNGTNGNLQPVICNNNGNFLTVTQGGEKKTAGTGEPEDDRLGNETVF